MFGKTIDHNFEFAQAIGRFFQLPACRFLVGISRKSMIWKTLDISADDALNGTTALNAIALLHGADILRVSRCQGSSADSTVNQQIKIKDKSKKTKSDFGEIPFYHKDCPRPFCVGLGN